MKFTHEDVYSSFMPPGEEWTCDFESQRKKKKSSALPENFFS